MHPEQDSHKTQKMITSFMVILAVVIVTVGVNSLKNKQSLSTPNSLQITRANDMPAASTMASVVATGYKDGAYAAASNYDTPGGTEGITLNITIQNGIVTDTSVANQSNNRDSAEYQTAFSQDYKSYVVGKKLDSLQLTGVSGSSLTSQGFNDALGQIRIKARA